MVLYPWPEFLRGRCLIPGWRIRELFPRFWKKENLSEEKRNNYANYIELKCHLVTSKCVARLTFTLRAISSGVVQHTVITVAKVNPISHRRSVEIVWCVNALMRLAHLCKKNGVIRDVTGTHDSSECKRHFNAVITRIYIHIHVWRPFTLTFTSSIIPARFSDRHSQRIKIFPTS